VGNPVQFDRLLEALIISRTVIAEIGKGFQQFLIIRL